MVTVAPRDVRLPWPDQVGIALAALLAVVAVWFAGDSRLLGFPLDDAWIHMSYGKNLAESGLLAYNPGVPATGATSPLWAVLVALAHLLGGDSVDQTVVIVYVLGGGLTIAGTVVAGRLAYALSQQRVVAWVAGGAIAISGPLAAAAFSGMEVALTATLMIAAVLACTHQRWGWAGAWLALAALARPEAAIVSMLCFAFAAWRTRTAPLGERVRVLGRLAAPSVVGGAVIIAYALWASGRALPATFYMKQASSIADLPARLGVAVPGLLGNVAPLQTGLAFLFLAGLVVGAMRPRESRGRLLLPAATALAFMLANLVLIPPAPDTFYHLRYLLPAVPLLIVSIVIGAFELGRLGPLGASERRRWIPLGILGALVLFESASSFGAAARRFHNDTRNIEEVQRTLGTWLAEHTQPQAWIATSDAGAVHYFANRPTVDVMGLNTPELFWDPAWAQQHPVAALALIPCWFKPRNQGAMRLVNKARTERYTVTQLQCMNEQIVLSCTTPGELAFEGMRTFAVTCDPQGLR